MSDDPLDLDTGLPARIAADAAALAPLYAKRRATAAGERRHRRGNAARSPGTRARAWRRRRRDRGGARAACPPGAFDRRRHGSRRRARWLSLRRQIAGAEAAAGGGAVPEATPARSRGAPRP